MYNVRPYDRKVSVFYVENQSFCGKYTFKSIIVYFQKMIIYISRMIVYFQSKSYTLPPNREWSRQKHTFQST